MSNFPTRAPIGLICGSLLAALSLIPILAAWQFLRPPLQRFYLGQFVMTYISGTPIGTVGAFFKGSTTYTYRVLVQNGHLAAGAIKPDSGSISVNVVRLTSPVWFHTWLLANVYEGCEVTHLLCAPILSWFATGVLLLILGALLDFQRRKRSREGHQLRGGELLTVDQFNRATKGDGFALYVRK